MRGHGRGRNGLAALGVAGLALVCGAGCSSLRAASFDHEVYVIKGVAQIRFGSAGLNWWLLTAGVSSVDVTPEPGAQISSAKMRIFEDANGNGAFDTGERERSFQATTTQNGMSFSNVQVSASDVSGWDKDSVQCSVEITDGGGNVSVWSHPL